MDPSIAVSVFWLVLSLLRQALHLCINIAGYLIRIILTVLPTIIHGLASLVWELTVEACRQLGWKMTTAIMLMGIGAIVIGGFALHWCAAALASTRRARPVPAPRPYRRHVIGGDVWVRKAARPRQIENENRQDDAEGDATCGICASSMRGLSVRQYPCCMSKVCTSCYKTWRVERGTCPYCNVDLDQLERKAKLMERMALHGDAIRRARRTCL
ncbi:unnamed protein product [Vitrella brassicaformis CCMP3155]|uniref:RING-type domain-containing protein n=2 Tax=Vitrella brassicaformis TaxID=1169539 RepID=A0A0G4EF32_VITBC|nr:unnamed protein product [Vitrella brassicaformis CCMP3155]|eukprot:CEL94025.1 unnamed protein product [Vitrella brassicaformis CCMP3155]